MATLEQLFQFHLDILQGKMDFGDKRTPVNRTVDGKVFDTGSQVIADNFGNATIWQTTQGGLAGFDHLLFWCDVDVFLELANTTPNPDERAIIFVPGGTLVSLPSRYIAGYASNTSRLDGANMVEATDYDDILEIRIQRDEADAVGDATYRLVLID